MKDFIPSLQLFDPDVAELNRVTVVLETDGSAGGEVRKGLGLQDLLTIEHDIHPIAVERDQKGVPFADVAIGFENRDASCLLYTSPSPRD